MVERQKKRLGEILIEEGSLSREHLDEALNYQKAHGGLIGQILISLGYLSEEDVVAALTAQLNIPYLPLSNYSLNLEAAKKLDEDFCRRNILVAFDLDEEHLFIALADPLNDSMIQDAEKKSQLKPQVFISTTTEIINMVDLIFSSKSPDNNNQNHKG